MSSDLIILCLSAYLLGSIPFAVLVSKGFHGIDVREHGSGNAGATNVFRVLGVKSGTIVLLLDIFKGMTAANLALLLWEPESVELAAQNTVELKLVFGILAVLGHLYPVFAKFKGGKGIATLLGLVIAINPLLALGCISCFVLVLLLSRTVSIASIISTMMFGIFTYLIYGYGEPILLFFGIFAVLLVLFTHRSNLVRLWNGEEKRITLGKKK